jgi:hypothetical protein
LAKPKERTLNRPEEAFPPERFQIGLAGELKSERWAICLGISIFRDHSERAGY